MFRIQRFRVCCHTDIFADDCLSFGFKSNAMRLYWTISNGVARRPPDSQNSDTHRCSSVLQITTDLDLDKFLFICARNCPEHAAVLHSGAVRDFEAPRDLLRHKAAKRAQSYFNITPNDRPSDASECLSRRYTCEQEILPRWVAKWEIKNEKMYTDWRRLIKKKSKKVAEFPRNAYHRFVPVPPSKVTVTRTRLVQCRVCNGFLLFFFFYLTNLFIVFINNPCYIFYCSQKHGS